MERGLILSLMALEKEFVTQQQLLTALQASLSNPFLKLDEILIQRGFVTKSQLQRLSVHLESNLELSSGQWEPVIQHNTAIASVYPQLIALAEKNPSLLEMVKRIGQTINITASPTNPSTRQTRTDSHSDQDPHSKSNIESKLDPYATITQPFDEDA